MATKLDDSYRRSQILEAAATVIMQRGVDSARLADIAADAGVSLGLVQHYFRHRERLLMEVFIQESDRIEATWRLAVDATAPPLDRLAEYIWLCTPAGSASAARSFGPGWSFWLEMWSKANRDPALRDVVRKVYASFAQPFISAIAEGVAAGEFHPVSASENIVDRLISCIDGLAVRTIIGELAEDRMSTLLVEALTVELALTPEQVAHVHDFIDQKDRHDPTDLHDSAGD